MRKRWPRLWRRIWFTVCLVQFVGYSFMAGFNVERNLSAVIVCGVAALLFAIEIILFFQDKQTNVEVAVFGYEEISE